MTQRIVPTVLGPAAADALGAQVRAWLGRLGRLDADGWSTPVPATGTTVAGTVAHLADGMGELADAWRRRLDPEEREVLLHVIDDDTGPQHADVPGPEALAGYRAATDALLGVLGTMRLDDWSWPVWSPLGGAEPLAAAVRRVLAHHHVHAHDLGEALGRVPEDDEATERLVVEFVLDALARRAGGHVPGPLRLEVVTAPPGGGTWTIVFDAPAPPPAVDNIWDELLGTHPAATEPHRIERGADPTARGTLRGEGTDLWRAAFRRGASLADLDVHGDTEARAAWATILDAAADGLVRVGTD
ncbi:MAG: maleylpyruvate isomerase N-terminal domain-containing protein [Actinomycetes bacterium]